MTKNQMLRAALYLEEFADIDLGSHSNENPDGTREWPDDPGYSRGSANKRAHDEKRRLVKALRALAKKAAT